ncbi:MAG TPA: MBOAT family O-acyltransferase [Polyangiaceae bacterium]|nr:MBOAT family O-acyltransferase [Polyangiaceae bacterium]
MLFNSPLYGVFLVTTFTLFWLACRRGRSRALLLVLASYVFYVYGTWDAARDEAVPLPAAGWALVCLGVLFVGSTIGFFLGGAIGRAKKAAVRNGLLLAAIVYQLGVLSVFKYWNFATDSLAWVASAAGVPIRAAHLNLVLPFGISFFTFETMSYAIDVWRGDLRPSSRYVDYLLFVGFFPHLVSGPIVRPAQMLPQLAAEPKADARMQARGLLRIATGLAKKIAVGDYLARTIVDRVFFAPERFTALEVLLAIYAYAAQIYADFSGYTDVAIGSAALFGYELPENFEAPYLAHNLQDFWRRWHISLSSWLRDYLYKPLGGSRGSSLKTYRNLMITMVLGGLWHGASWTFVAWGTLHGVGLVATRLVQRARVGPSGLGPVGVVRRGVAVFATFQFVCFAWVFFRAPTFAHAILALRRVVQGGWGLEHVTPRVIGVLGAAGVLHLIPRTWETKTRERFACTPAFVQGLVLAAFALALHLVADAKPEPFVYGQF